MTDSKYYKLHIMNLTFKPDITHLLGTLLKKCLVNFYESTAGNEIRPYV